MKKGSFVYIDFVAKVGDEVFDLTDENLARELGIWREDAKYGPVGVIVGEGMVIEGVDEALEQMEVGQEKYFEVPPEKAFGFRNPGLVKTFSISEFDFTPEPGMLLEFDTGVAKVLSVSSGRVRIDFNNPLAGKTLKYRLKIVKEVNDEEEKLKIITDYFGTGYSLSGGKVKLEGRDRDVARARELIRKYLTYEVEE